MNGKQVSIADAEATDLGTIAVDAERRLLTEKEDLLARINSEPHSSQAPKAGEQEADYPAEDEIREVEFSHLEMHHLRLMEINDALERISRGIFGYCLQCKAMISESRLKADPAVANCYLCQTNAEEGFKTPR